MLLPVVHSWCSSDWLVSLQLNFGNDFCLLLLYSFVDDGTYAMKKVLIQNSEQLELVKEEIRVSSLFSHPNLLPLLDHAIISVKVKIWNT